MDYSKMAGQLLLFEFAEYPKAEPVDLSKFFVVEESKGDLQSTNTLRDDFLRTMRGKFTLSQRKSAVEAYIPYMLSLQASIRAAKIPLKKKLEYKWTSGVSTVHRTFTATTITFEVVMTLSSQVMILNDLAVHTAQDYLKDKNTQTTVSKDTWDKTLRDALQNAKMAIAICDEISNTHIPTLSIPSTSLPMECYPHILECIKLVCEATVQSIIFLLSDLQPATPLAIGQMLLGLSTKYDYLGQKLKANPADAKSIKPWWSEQAMFLSGHSKMIAMQYLAQHDFTLPKPEAGRAVCYILEAIKVNDMHSGLNLIKPVRNSLLQTRTVLSELIQKYQQANQSNYFQPVPPFPPPGYPSAATILGQPVTYSAPPLPFTSLK
ncbi:hypothetical protein BLNAU_6969 [Blattamonas nauphoetae]|uniref:Uncharacterized protein n=1 Tax=Blattamonas nauphoetae TaxID=2049346 RepID=A0ABQ9Y2W9_9EUKA|nr:hypothetical protein BLNAU_6969 [Blattamonas nauphoetae]